MSYASKISNGTGSINARGEMTVKVDSAPRKPVEAMDPMVKENTGNKNDLSPQLNLKELEMALTKAVKNTRFSYKVDDNIDMIIVKIIDKSTDEVIKEIPGEEIQRLHENLQEAIGLLFDTQI